MPLRARDEPTLVVVTGPPGSGKTTIATQLARRIRARDYAPLALDAPCFELVTDRFEDVRFGDIEAAMPAPEDNGRRPALVVVSGPPATGKTSIAKKMAAELGIPFITKDTLKERLYETFGHGDGVEDAIDRAALAMLFSVVESNLAAGVSVMAESNFDARSDVQPFRELCAAHDVRIVQVHMDRDTERLLEHFAERSASGDRHPGHEDDPEDAETVRRELEAGLWNALEIPGALIEADADEDRGAIVARVRAVLEQE